MDRSSVSAAGPVAPDDHDDDVTAIKAFLAPVSRLDGLTADLRDEGETVLSARSRATQLCLYANAYMMVDIGLRAFPDFIPAIYDARGDLHYSDGVLVWGRSTNLGVTRLDRVVALWQRVEALPMGVPVRWQSYTGEQCVFQTLEGADPARECLVQDRFLRAVVRDVPALQAAGALAGSDAWLDMQDVDSEIPGLLRVRYRGRLLAAIKGYALNEDGAIFMPAGYAAAQEQEEGSAGD